MEDELWRPLYPVVQEEAKQEGAVVTLKLCGTVVVNEGEAMEVKMRFA